MNLMPKVSVIIPTHNRPELVGRAISSVLGQSYHDFELIIVDVGLKKRADHVIMGFSDERITYIKTESEKNGSEARNIGIRNAKGTYIAFLDDDDQWIPEKLAIQMNRFEYTNDGVGFCFSAVKNIYSDSESITEVPGGISDYFERAIANFNGFLTVTLIIKRGVFGNIGLFDERLPSHQEIDLIIRISKRYKGLGINRPLVYVNMSDNHDSVGGNTDCRILGRIMLIKKYRDIFEKRPEILARNYFELGLMFRSKRDIGHAGYYFAMACVTGYSTRYLLHFINIVFMGLPFRIFRRGEHK